MTPKNERQFLALSSRIKQRANGIANPSVRDLTSLSNLAEANITPFGEMPGNRLTAGKDRHLFTDSAP
jgi:hypothetical protein